MDTKVTKDQYSFILNVLENFRPIVVDLRYDDYVNKGYRPIKNVNKVYSSFTHHCIDPVTKKKYGLHERSDEYNSIYDIRVKKDNYTNTMTIAMLLSCNKCIDIDYESNYLGNDNLEQYRSKWIKHERSVTSTLDFHDFLLNNFQWIYDHKVKEIDKNTVDLFNKLYNYDRVNFNTGEIYSDRELADRKS